MIFPPAPERPAAGGAGRSVLVVEFPPQHVIEQAYLRQGVALPGLAERW